MRISEIMQDKPFGLISISAEFTLRQAAVLLTAHRIGLLLVCDDAGALHGVLSERDIVTTVGTHGSKASTMKIADVMTREVITCRPSDYAADVLDTMNEKRFRHMPVLLDCKLVGLVSIRDILFKLHAEAVLDRDKLYSAGLAWL